MVEMIIGRDLSAKGDGGNSMGTHVTFGFGTPSSSGTISWVYLLLLFCDFFLDKMIPLCLSAYTVAS